MVIEYSEIGDLKDNKNEDGSLMYNAGSPSPCTAMHTTRPTLCTVTHPALSGCVLQARYASTTTRAPSSRPSAVWTHYPPATMWPRRASHTPRCLQQAETACVCGCGHAARAARGSSGGCLLWWKSDVCAVHASDAMHDSHAMCNSDQCQRWSQGSGREGRPCHIATASPMSRSHCLASQRRCCIHHAHLACHALH